jgi:hypothetical protein
MRYWLNPNGERSVSSLSPKKMLLRQNFLGSKLFFDCKYTFGRIQQGLQAQEVNQLGVLSTTDFHCI